MSVLEQMSMQRQNAALRTCAQLERAAWQLTPEEIAAGVDPLLELRASGSVYARYLTAAEVDEIVNYAHDSVASTDSLVIGLNALMAELHYYERLFVRNMAGDILVRLSAVPHDYSRLPSEQVDLDW